MSSIRQSIVHGFFVFLLMALLATSASADTITWTNGSGGLWSNASNWNSGAGPVPGSTDDVVITLDGTYTVTLDVSATVASLTLGGSSGTQKLSVIKNA